jgi:hypothetical protein
MAGIGGIGRTVNVVVHALLAGEGLPSVSGGYLVRATVYGAYLLRFWYLSSPTAQD